jgi:hypothetical protein
VSLAEIFQELGFDIDYIPVGYACVLLPIDVGHNGPLKCQIIYLHSEWCIKHYANLCSNEKFPIPNRHGIIDCANKAMNEINGVVIRNTFLSIGYYHPEDDNLNLEAELKGLQMKSDVFVDHIDNLGINLVIPDSLIEQSPHLEDMVEAF